MNETEYYDQNVSGEASRQYATLNPENAIEYNTQLIQTDWGKTDKIPAEFIERISNKYIVKDENGEDAILKDGFWELLGFYTKDMRLGNLDNFDYKMCIYNLNIANECLKLNFYDAFSICLSNVATILELSQSKGGFFRKRSKTMRMETSIQSSQPQKRFGGIFK